MTNEKYLLYTAESAVKYFTDKALTQSLTTEELRLLDDFKFALEQAGWTDAPEP